MPPSFDPDATSPDTLEDYARLHESAAWVLRRLAAARRSGDRLVIGACLSELERLGQRQTAGRGGGLPTEGLA